ncbi:MAG TPA: protein-L-isoaspartate(D-aspartate) O-methyltransferase [Candidatus Krumholzibacterium sp.]|nr:protein-L-isoaspartate(D-aspartate) O-methyltransferase [Candidatus Krumholzibacterium sp.]
MIDGEDTGHESRIEMVHSQIVERGVVDQAVLDAMIRVPRESFIDPSTKDSAFFDGPLPIGFGQTISQPYIVAYMTEQLFLRRNDRVLEIGTGCGYQTAVLAEIAARVYTLEIIDALARKAKERLLALGYRNIEFRTGDGADGWPEEAPFDAIIVTAAPAVVPRTLTDQLADGGRLVIPVGTHMQYLRRLTRSGDDIRGERLIGVRFVPLTGKTEEDGN